MNFACSAYRCAARRPVIRITFITQNLAKPVRSYSYKMTGAAKASAEPANGLIDFLNASPTPYHAVSALKDKLKAAGFEEIQERENWSQTCKPGGKYFLTRNASTIVAFAIGAKYAPGNPIGMIGTHTDSPCLRIKPVSKAQSDGYLQVACETYGGGLWHTWFDRDLSVAGRVMVRTGKSEFHQKLIRIDRPILRIPTLAVHFERAKEFSFSNETQLYPIAGLVAAELNRQGKPESESMPDEAASDEKNFQPMETTSERHHAYIVELMAHEAGVSADDVLDFEAILYDTQKSCVGGLNNEFVISARLDNLCMTYCGAEALIESTKSAKSLENEFAIRLVAAFDHEEIGSTSAQGANSSVLPSIIKRLAMLGPAKNDLSAYATAYEQTLATSFLISADMAHAVHPNYPGKYESRHKPQMNKGTVIKVNANQRYATNSPGIVLLQACAKRVGVPLQMFVINQDMLCGSTIGPMLSAKLGTRTLDLGNPQLSMHSIRELAGVYDVDYTTKLFASFYDHYSELEQKILVD